MPLNECLVKAKEFLPDIDVEKYIKQRDVLKGQGMSEAEADARIKNQVIKEQHENLHNELNDIKSKAKLPKAKYQDLAEPTYEKPRVRVTAEQLESAQPKPNQPTEPPAEPPKENVPVTEGGEENKVGLKNSSSENIRQAYNLPKVELPKLGNDLDRLTEGKRLVDSGEINPVDVIDKIKKGNGKIGMQPDEAKAMLYYTRQLASHADNLMDQKANADTPEEREHISNQLAQVSDLMDAATEANMLAGTPWSDVGQTRQINVDDGFNPSREKAVIKDAYGGKIPDEVNKKLEAAQKERDDAIEKAKQLEEKLKQKEAESKLSEMKSNRTKGSDFKEKRKNLIEDFKAAIKEQNDYLKKQGIQKMGAGFTLTPKMVKIIGQLAKTYIDEGLEKIEDIVSKIHDNLKEHLEGISKKDIRDAIAGAETQKLETKAKGLESKAENKNVSVGEKLKLKFQKNSEWVKANQRVKNAEFKIKQIKKDAFDSQKNYYQKGLNWVSRAVRASVLSGTNVLYKLASALTIGGAIKRIPEQLFGGMWSQVYKGIAQRAPIEGFYNVKSELKFYKEFFNLKKFGQNVWSIIKDHESLLNKELGQPYSSDLAETTMAGKQKTIGGKIAKTGLDIANRVLLLPSDVHSMIKEPLKRATYEASLRNAMVWAEKQGMDISDPLIQQSLKTAAFKRANYEIFQEHSKLTDWVNNKKAEWDKSGNLGSTGKFLTDVAMPVMTVSTNIVKRLATTSPIGFIRGHVKAIEAYKKGLDSLSPEEHDAIFRQLKQGTLGIPLWLIGWFGAAHFGGLYSQFDPNKKRKEGELTSDMMEVDGHMIPKPVQHALPFEIIQLAATMRHIYDNYKENKGASDFNALYHAGMGAIGAGLEQVPIVETPVHAVNAVTNPYEANKFEKDMQGRFQPQILKETGVVGNKSGSKLDQLKSKYADSEDLFKNNIKAYDKHGNEREISTGEFKKYKEERDRRISDNIDKLYNNGIGGKKWDNMTEKERNDEIKSMKESTTDKLKKEMFGHGVRDAKLIEQRRKLYQ